MLNVNKANLASPAFTGTPTAPEPSWNNNSTRIATTAFARQKNATRIEVGSGSEASGIASIAIGFDSKAAGTSSTALGLDAKATGDRSTALGNGAMGLELRSIALGADSEASGGNSTALGYLSKALGGGATALGNWARSTHNDTAVISASVLNVESTVTNQILLGRTVHTPFAYRALSVISDQRDKDDISPLKYNALEFINKIEPKQYKLDFRSDYTRLEEVTEKEYGQLDDYTKQHRVQEIPIYSINNEIEFIDYPLYEEADETRSTADKFKTLIKSKLLRSREEAIVKYKDIRLSKVSNMESLTDEFREDVTIQPIEELTDKFIEEKIIKVRDMKLVRKFLPKDGSKTNNRYHNEVLAQQVKAVDDEMGFDFCGFKVHSVNGGDDLYSISYEEFIAPMIGAIQQLTKRVEELENKLISQ